MNVPLGYHLARVLCDRCGTAHHPIEGDCACRPCRGCGEDVAPERDGPDDPAVYECEDCRERRRREGL